MCLLGTRNRSNSHAQLHSSSEIWLCSLPLFVSFFQQESRTCTIVPCVSIQLVANPVFIPCESIHTRHFRERKPNKMSSLVPGVMAIMVSVASKNNVLSGFICEHGDTMLHLAVCAHCSRTAFHSVRLDEWAAIRERPPPSGRLERIFRVRRRAAKVTALIGAGYTPRIVFLAGMMLRSLQVRPLCVGILASASFWRTRGQPL